MAVRRYVRSNFSCLRTADSVERLCRQGWFRGLFCEENVTGKVKLFRIGRSWVGIALGCRGWVISEYVEKCLVVLGNVGNVVLENIGYGGEILENVR